MEVLKCGAQKYVWGKLAADSEVAKLLHVDQNEEYAATRFAELWVGVHPNVPSQIASSGEPLREFLDTHKQRYLGDRHVSYFSKEKPNLIAEDVLASTSVPFLLKVLSIDMPLSIQAHPTRALAEVLHARDPSHYPDPNHKPELIVAITPIEALCCFRPLSEILYFVESCGPLRRLLGDANVKALREAAPADVEYRMGGGTTPACVKVALRSSMETMYVQGCSSDLVGELCGLVSNPDFIASLPAHSNPLMASAFRLFAQTNKTFPGDVGLWMVFFLNYIQLQPGEALYLGASEPHAYLSGNGVEIMANSDNVVRAGLTHKFKDVDTLLDMLTYDTNALSDCKYGAPSASASVKEYTPPCSSCDDFSLLAINLGGGADRPTSASHTLPSVGLGLCLDGQCIITCDGTSHTVERGVCFVIPVGEVSVSTTSTATIFIGTTNVHNTNAAAH